MQSPHSLNRRRVCVEHLQLLCLVCCILLGLPVPCNCSSSACNSCESTICQPTPSNCPYDLVKDECNCCSVCPRGLDESCGGYYINFGTCAEGLECVVDPEEGLSPAELEQLPGTCQVAPTTSEATQSITTSSTTETATSTTTESPPLATTESPTELECKPSCSLDYCKGRARVCSARGLEYKKNPTRNSCQHTSCRACFLLITPSCNFPCGELPTKSCLEDFYTCVRNYLQQSAENFMIRLGDSRATENASRGRVICHVPDLSS